MQLFFLSCGIMEKHNKKSEMRLFVLRMKMIDPMNKQLYQTCKSKYAGEPNDYFNESVDKDEQMNTSNVAKIKFANGNY